MRVKKPYRKSRRWYKVLRARAHRRARRRIVMLWHPDNPPMVSFWDPTASPLSSLLTTPLTQ